MSATAHQAEMAAGLGSAVGIFSLGQKRKRIVAHIFRHSLAFLIGPV
jgi:hypothetical protein